MADNVYTMKKQKENPQEHIEKSLKKNKSWILGVIAAVVVVVAVVSIVIVSSEKTTEKRLSAVADIEYNYVNKSDKLSEEEIEARKADTLEALSKYVKKGGVVGVRANLLAADIYFSSNDYENAKACYEKAGKAKKNAYTSGVAYFNAGTCCDLLNQFENAAVDYEKSAEYKDNLNVTHALFSEGKSYELAGMNDKALEAYNKLCDSYPNDEWAKLAQSRIIALSNQ